MLDILGDFREGGEVGLNGLGGHETGVWNGSRAGQEQGAAFYKWVRGELRVVEAMQQTQRNLCGKNDVEGGGEDKEGGAHGGHEQRKQIQARTTSVRDH